MALQAARVQRVDGSGIWVVADAMASCEPCSKDRGCGLSVFARIFSSAEPHCIQVESTIPVATGDRVLIEVNQTSLAHAALLLYGLPLVLLIAPPLVLALLWPGVHEGLLMMSALAGLCGGVVLMRRSVRRMSVANIAKPVVVAQAATTAGAL